VAKAIFETRGNTPRIYRNTIVFLAADKTRLQDLDEAARKFLAWESIVAEADKLDLTRQQVKRAEEKNGGRRRRDGQASRNISVAACRRRGARRLLSLGRQSVFQGFRGIQAAAFIIVQRRTGTTGTVSSALRRKVEY
jgi:hypothetical protein